MRLRYSQLDNLCAHVSERATLMVSAVSAIILLFCASCGSPGAPKLTDGDLENFHQSAHSQAKRLLHLSENDRVNLLGALQALDGVSSEFSSGLIRRWALPKDLQLAGDSGDVVPNDRDHDLWAHSNSKLAEVHLLSKCGRLALPLLVGALRSKELSVATAASNGIVAIGTKSLEISQVLASLCESEGRLASHLCMLAKRIEPRHSGVVPALLLCVTRGNLSTRIAALDAIGDLGVDAIVASQILKKEFSRNPQYSGPNRVRLVAALSGIGDEVSSDMLGEVVGQLTSSDSMERWNAVRLLSQSPKLAEQCATQLGGLLRDESSRSFALGKQRMPLNWIDELRWLAADVLSKSGENGRRVLLGNASGSGMPSEISRVVLRLQGQDVGGSMARVIRGHSHAGRVASLNALRVSKSPRADEINAAIQLIPDGVKYGELAANAAVVGSLEIPAPLSRYLRSEDDEFSVWIVLKAMEQSKIIYPEPLLEALRELAQRELSEGASKLILSILSRHT